MPTYNSIISRTDADALIPTDVATPTDRRRHRGVGGADALPHRATRDEAERAARPLRPPDRLLGRRRHGLEADDRGRWAGVTSTAEEIACIVPIPEAVIDDASFDIWGELRPALAEAIAQYSTPPCSEESTSPPPGLPRSNPPPSQPANTAEVGTSTPAQGGIVGDVGTAFDKVEADGYQVSGVAAVAAMKALLRKARDANGQQLVAPGSPTIEGVPLSYPLPGTVGATTRAIVGDFDLAVVGIRQDITYKMLDQAVISDAAGVVVYNLAQQDMVAMRVVARYAYATAVPATRTGGGRLPVRRPPGRHLREGSPPQPPPDGPTPSQAGGGLSRRASRRDSGSTRESRFPASSLPPRATSQDVIDLARGRSTLPASEPITLENLQAQPSPLPRRSSAWRMGRAGVRRAGSRERRRRSVLPDPKASFWGRVYVSGTTRPY